MPMLLDTIVFQLCSSA